MNAGSPPSRRGRVPLLLGLALVPLGIVAYAVQLRLHRLAVPWYVPASTFLGVVLVAASMRQRRTGWRGLALVALRALGGFELATINALRLPPYSGPIAIGKPFPPFEARLADGTPFTQAGLVGGQATAMVFFRGRW